MVSSQDTDPPERPAPPSPPGASDRVPGPKTAEVAIASDRDAVYQQDIARNLPRNYAAHYVHGMLGMTGFRLVNTPTFVPAFLYSISGSDAIVGLGLALQQLGGIISPVFGATQIEHRRKILPISVALGLLMRLQVLGLAVSAWLFKGVAGLVFALAFLFLLGLFQGSQRVAFQLLLAKVIPIRLRGRLQAWRNLTGGLIAAALSYYAGAWLVANNVTGNGYAATFFIAFILTSLGLAALQMLMREPDPPSIRARVAFRDRIRDFPALIRDDKGFAWFLVARTLAMGSRIGQPFFFLHAAVVLSVSAEVDPVRFGQMLAVLSLAYMGADTVSNLVWGYLSDRSGFRFTFVIAMALNFLAVALLLAPGASFASVVIAFIGAGAAQSGYLMASTNIVLEFGHRDDVAMRMALSNTAEGAMGALGPLMGGMLALTWGYAAAFMATLACVGASLLVLLLRVDEPRRRAG